MLYFRVAFQNIWYLETLSTAINHWFSPLKFTKGEKLRLKKQTHNTHPWSSGSASARNLSLALNLQYQSGTAILCQVICPTVGSPCFCSLLKHSSPCKPVRLCWLKKGRKELTDFVDSRDPEDRVSRLPRLLELRWGEDDGESSI